MKTLDPLLDEISGQRAFQEAVALYESDHWFSYDNFARTAEHVAQRLRDIGLTDVRIDAIPANNETRYSGWTTAQAWDVKSAMLDIIQPQPMRLADWHDVPHHLIMRSAPAAGKFPIVSWSPDDGQDMAGRIAFTHLRPAEVQHKLKAAGGTGLISDFLPELPGIRIGEDCLDHVLWEQVCFRPNPGNMWGFMLSPRQGRQLEQKLAAGPVLAQVHIDARVYDGITRAIDALIPADEPAPESGEILLVAHLYEPGANDNASGAGLTLELARAIRTLQRAGRVRLRRGIRLLLAYEGRGTVAWIHRHTDTVRRMIAGLNLDEIGVDQTIGRSKAHFFLPPYSNPSFVGDLLVDLAHNILPGDIRWLPVGDRADIILDTRFSDPSLNVPTPCMIQYPAWTYHTSRDTPEALSPRVLEQFGRVAGAYLLRLATLGPEDAPMLDEVLARHAGEFTSPDVAAAGLLRERLEAKRTELARWGISLLPRLGQVIASLPRPPASTGAIVPHRLTLATPGGTHVADTLPPAERIAFRAHLLDHGLDLVFHHFFYWADGQRTIEDICLRIDDETRSQPGSDAIPRTTTGKLIHTPTGASTGLDRAAVLKLYEMLEAAGLMRLERH